MREPRWCSASRVFVYSNIPLFDAVVSGAANGGEQGVPGPSETLGIFCHKSLEFQMSSIGADQEDGLCW